LWAIARYDLGCTENEVGELSPLAFYALLQRKKMADKHAWFRAGTVAAAVINFSMCRAPNSRPLGAEAFVPEYLLEDENAIPFEKLPIDEQRKIVKNWVKTEFEENDNLTPEQREAFKKGTTYKGPR
jgi:hypothetical protein